MLRILQVFGRMDRGGAESMIMNMYRNIDRTKIQFDFVVHTEEKCDFDDEIKSLGGRVFSVPRFNIKNAFFYKKAWRELLSEHPEWEIIHGHIMSVASIYLKIAKSYGLTTISHSHTSGKDYEIKTIIKMIFQKGIKADYYMACSIEAGEWLFGKKILESNRFNVLPNAIDVKKYTYNTDTRKRIRNELGIEKEVLIGHIGSFSNVKNHRFLIEVFKKINDKSDNVKLILVGRGELEEDIKKRVEELGLQKRVIFTGVRSDVNELLQAMDIFVFPSLYEGLPVTLVEAQAAGLPCYISDSISKESILVNKLVTTISLNESADNWAKCIMSYNKERKDYSKDIIEKGFDVHSTSKWLEEFYLNASKQQ